MPDHDERLTTDDLAGGSPRSDVDTDPTTGHDTDRPGLGDRGNLDRDGDLDRDRGDLDRDAGTSGTPVRSERDEPLLPPHDLEELRRRWDGVQTHFVDDPRRAVEDADGLVAEVMRNLAETFSAERKSLEEQWERAGEADTETLRVTLQRYRSFFNRLLST